MVPQSQEGKIRSRVLLVNVPATVTNAKDEFVSNLDAKDFQVTDNGVPQKIADLDLAHLTIDGPFGGDQFAN